MKTPDEIVSEKVVSALLEKGLITSEDAKKLGGRLVGGVVKDSEWLTLLRMGAQSPVKAKTKEAKE